MGGITWATPEQSAFLNARMDQFFVAQSERKLISFYASTCHDYFERWSERDQLFSTPESSNAQLSPAESEALSVAIVKRKKVSI
jgi:hypothetical protein